jgi:N-acetylglucosamine-6-phosphate deacetylase
MRAALVNGRLLTANGLESGRTLLISGARIEALVDPDDSRCSGAAVVDLKGQLLLPGFIDVQVNGGGGVLFNDDPSLESIRAIGAAHRRFGTTGFLPTLISDDLDTIGRAINTCGSSIAAWCRC